MDDHIARSIASHLQTIRDQQRKQSDQLTRIANALEALANLKASV